MIGAVGMRKKPISIFILASVLSCTVLFAQKSQVTPGRQASIDEFTSGNYEQAYTDFGQLLAKYPKDPLYKYYSGACLVMLKRDPERALQLLEQSVNGASVVKSLPPEAIFYLGRARQMNGKFAEAIDAYKSYTGEAGRKNARELGVPGFIQECEDRKGMIAASSPATVGNVPAATPAAALPAVVNAGQLKAGEAVPEREPEEILPAEQAKITSDSKEPAVPAVRKELPADQEALLDEALKLQYKADSLTRIIADQKRQLETVPDQEKGALRMKISQNEMQASTYQRSADSKYSVAQVRMNQQADASAGTAIAATAVVSTQEPVSHEPVIAVEAPSVPVSTGARVEGKTNTAGELSLFEVLPGGAAYPDDKIKIDPELPQGLLYRIQLAVFRNPVAPSFFKGITPVYGLRIAGTDKTNYYAGMFRRSADAKKALPQVREAGFRDAFIVSVFDGKPVSGERAAVMEKEWGNKPLFPKAGAASDTLPPTLVFRVEVARVPKALKPEQVEALKTTAGNRGLDILHLADGNLVYLIGNFITFESAAEYADLLVRNNYRTAKVVAWLGSREVPIETAKQLFNGL